jgi:hypothetical protein
MAGSSLLSVQVLPFSTGHGHGKKRENFCPIFITWGLTSQDNKGITRIPGKGQWFFFLYFLMDPRS